MTLLLSLALLWLCGLLTVTTETFTHLIVERSWRAVLKGFFTESIVFTLTALAWGLSVWALLILGGQSVEFRTLVTLMGFSHAPLLAYPLTVIPSIGYRLEQFLRFLVYLLFAASVTILGVPPLTAGFTCVGGWILHFLAVERRVLRRGEGSLR